MAVILFSMDSALECFVFAMNAIGFAKTPQDVLHLTAQPKLPGSFMSSAEHTVESLGSQFQILIDELLPIAKGEIAVAYGYSVVKTSAR